VPSFDPGQDASTPAMCFEVAGRIGDALLSDDKRSVKALIEGLLTEKLLPVVDALGVDKGPAKNMSARSIAQSPV